MVSTTSASPVHNVIRIDSSIVIGQDADYVSLSPTTLILYPRRMSASRLTELLLSYPTFTRVTSLMIRFPGLTVFNGSELPGGFEATFPSNVLIVIALVTLIFLLLTHTHYQEGHVIAWEPGDPPKGAVGYDQPVQRLQPFLLAKGWTISLLSLPFSLLTLQGRGVPPISTQGQKRHRLVDLFQLYCEILEIACPPTDSQSPSTFFRGEH